jgi:ribosomal protein S18 acetylase RimI-like enzyme
MTSADDEPVSALRPMTASEYAQWVEQSIAGYALDKVTSGQWSPEESLELSRKENNELLPLGLETPGNCLFTIVDRQAVAVGTLWFAVKKKFGADIAYVFDVGIRPERQREGHAARAFLALEDEVRRRGLTGIALHVFGHNDAARALYAGLGFQPTNISLFKPIGSARA